MDLSPEVIAELAEYGHVRTEHEFVKFSDGVSVVRGVKKPWPTAKLLYSENPYHGKVWIWWVDMAFTVQSSLPDEGG